ncbi:MAG: CocE/NonD family hydrolase [Solirubrobacteraceae bacterium]
MRLAARLVVGAIALVPLVMGATAQAAEPTIGANGRTAPVFDYQQAVRERVFIPQPGIDQDRDGVDDKIAADIIRPAESGPDVRMPAIIDPSPYYTTICRGNESQCMEDFDDDGVNDTWPLFYDNYFVPRGYAYVLGQMNGIGFSTGCPYHGGPTDIAGEKSIIDWLNGRVPGEDADGNPMVADWHNGSSAMIGKSYDGTLANGVAATGVEGLKTIVPISAISAWYEYSRTGGIRHNTNYPAFLSNAVTNPDRREPCAPSREDFNEQDGDETGDINQFWDDRDYNRDIEKVKASVFIAHGFQDDNVRMNHAGMWWEGLKANRVERKLWLLRTGHTEPFDARRAEWVATLHRWFDHYLYGIENGIDDEPKVTIEDSKDVYRNYAEWPIPGTQGVDLYLRGTSATEAGTLGGRPGGGATDSLTFTTTNSNENGYINNPEGPQANRRVFLSEPLKKDLRMSGTPTVDVQASLRQSQSNLGAIIVDYGEGTQVTRSRNGISNTTTRTCWGESSEVLDPDGNSVDSACYLEVTKPTVNVTQWRVSRGVLDSSNRFSLRLAEPVTIDQKERFAFPSMPTEHVFEAGHRIGIIIVGNLSGYISGTNGTEVTLDTRLSKVTLPLLGGYGAAVSSGAIPPGQ